MKNVALIIFLIFLAGPCIPDTATAGPASPAISWADLDGYIDTLPVSIRTDPVSALRARLRELDSKKSRSPESKGLEQAIGLISLARTIRITHSDDSRPLLAGL